MFDNDASATAAITGIYSQMMHASTGFSDGSQSISVLGGLAADELSDYGVDPNRKAYFLNSLTPSNAVNQAVWSELYGYVYSANAVIEGLQRSAGTSEPVRTELRAEALFVRSFCFFYLSQLYGSVPLITTTAYTVNAHARSATPTEITAQIIQDLTFAKTDLPELSADRPRTRPTRLAASALLARVYLYQADWGHAITEASAVIDQGSVLALG